jgi:hypothetical protein
MGRIFASLCLIVAVLAFASVGPNAEAQTSSANAPPSASLREDLPAGNAPPGNNAPSKRKPSSVAPATARSPVPAPSSAPVVAHQPLDETTGAALETALKAWPEMWSVPVGSVVSDTSSYGATQIAVRGSLVVVASRGAPGVNDARDGLHVIDGRRDAPSPPSDRTVRIIPSPTLDGRADANTDAVGVALDGDFAVFGTYGGVVEKTRLDGVPVWKQAPFPAGLRSGLPALVDIGGDGKLDVIVPVAVVRCPPGAAGVGDCDVGSTLRAIALDGSTGRLLWELHAEKGAEEAKAHCGEFVVGAYKTLWNGRRWIEIGCVGSPASTGAFWIDRQRAEPIAESTASVDRDLASFVPQVDAPVPALPTSRAQPYLFARLDGLGIAYGAGSDKVQLVGTPRSFDKAVESPPSIGDVDGDGGWDVLLVAGGILHALSTGSHVNVLRSLWRGDVAASGTLSPIASPADYASRVAPRDVVRWLRSDQEPTDRAFGYVEVSGNAGAEEKLEQEPLEPTLHTEEVIPSITVACGPTYGINEGTLVTREGAEWRVVAGAPWPVVALGCEGGSLLLRQPDGLRYSLPPPKPWRTVALVGVPCIAFGLLVLAWWTRRRAPGSEGKAAQGRVREVMLTDAPRTTLAQGSEAQQALVRGLTHMLDNAGTKPPVTVALYGPWGSGKSSVMQMLRGELRATGRYIDVCFNAWRFHREPQLAPPLLQAIVDRVADQSDALTRFSVVWERIRTASLIEVLRVVLVAVAAAIVLVVCLRSAASTATSTGVLGTVVLLGLGAWRKLLVPLMTVFSIEPMKLLSTKNPEQRVAFVQNFTSEFQKVMTRLPPDTQLVVFVDDLDRCPPDRIADALETLSMLADTGSGFFVLALEPRTIQRAIELVNRPMLKVARKEDPAEAVGFGARYLEKMITLGVHVPPPAPSDVELDQRSTDGHDEVKPLRWLRDNVLPPWWWALVAAVLGVLLVGAQRLGGPTWLDSIAQLINPAAAVAQGSGGNTGAPAQVASSGSSAPASIASATPAATVATIPQSGPSASKTGAVPSAPVAVDTSPRAPVDLPVHPPAIATEPAAESPTRQRKLDNVLWFGCWTVGVVFLVVMAMLAGAHWGRVRRIRRAPPMGLDSTPFKEGLGRALRRLPPNPRSALRFTNTCRFLYRVIAEKRDPESNPWTASFFDAMQARWQSAAEPAVEGWLKEELDHWAPKMTPAPAEAPPAPLHSETTTVKRVS